MSKIFFQSSMPRAGSTLLQNILAQNPEFHTTPTSGVLEMLYQSRNAFTTSDEFKATTDEERDLKAWRGYCNGALHGYYEAITDKPYIVDKSRGWGIHYDWVEKFLPYKPKMICMVRDLRSIFASMEKNYRKNPEIYTGTDNPVELSGTTPAKRIDVWKNGMPIGISLDRLEDMLNREFRTNIQFIRYEGLFNDPQSVMNTIYDYLEVDRFEHDFNNIEQTTHENDVIHRPYGDHKIRNKLEPLKQDYEEVLGKEICDWIVNNHRWYFETFGYSE
jgi:sulfotransferase